MILRNLAGVVIVSSMIFTMASCLDTHRENEYTVLIMLFDELYYIPKTVDQSEYTIKEKLGVITSTGVLEEPPEENFSSNSINNEIVYTVEEMDNLFVIPYETERHGDRYHVLKVYNSGK